MWPRLQSVNLPHTRRSVADELPMPMGCLGTFCSNAFCQLFFVFFVSFVVKKMQHPKVQRRAGDTSNKIF